MNPTPKKVRTPVRRTTDVYDEVIYAMMSRPYITREEDRWNSYVSKFHKKTADPYATR